MREIKNNRVIVTGVVSEGMKLDHETYGEKFYQMTIVSERCSGREDMLPVMVSERLLDTSVDYTGQYIQVEGEFRSITLYESDSNKSHLKLMIFAKSVQIAPMSKGEWDRNRIKLNGTICSVPLYRVSPQGKEICDILLSVERTYGKTDCLPCVIWGEQAKYLAEQKPGTKMKISGKVRSHDYVKDGETKRAYEVFINEMQFDKEWEVREIA